MTDDWGWTLWLALAVGGIVAAALAWWVQHRSAREITSFDAPSLPGSDWQEIAARYHHSRVEALRGWVGDDDELAREAPPGEPPTASSDGAPVATGRPDRPAASRADIPLPMRHDRML